MKKIGCILGMAGVLTLVGCAEKEEILVGKRESLRSVLQDDMFVPSGVDQENQVLGISLPAVSRNANWTQRSGTPSTRISHPALSQTALQPVWNVSIGAGDGRRNRITADPVVSGGQVFALDSEARVTAVSTNGAVQWARDLRPETDKARDASGGGLAVAGNTLFVSSGFGLVTALDVASGENRWQQKLGATASGSPTVAGGAVYLVAGDDLAWVLDAATGRIRWQAGASPDVNNIMGGPAPAVTDRLAIFGFGSGQVRALQRDGGLPVWSEVIAGQRSGFSRNRVGDITGDPVVSGGTVYVGSHSGQLLALDADTGLRLWAADEGPMSPVWVAGGSVFLVSDRNELVRLDANTGARIWGTKLAHFTKKRPGQQKELFAHHGPVMAGGRLLVASNDGAVRMYDPTSGAETGATVLPGGATTNPVVAGGTLYVVNTKGQLYAFR